MEPGDRMTIVKGLYQISFTKLNVYLISVQQKLDTIYYNKPVIIEKMCRFSYKT